VKGVNVGVPLASNQLGIAFGCTRGMASILLGHSHWRHRLVRDTALLGKEYG
jgi:hypothetical protein